MQKRGLPIAYVACLGNAAAVGLAELASELISDERVTAIGMYVEGIGDAAAFAAFSQKARAAGKGVVVIKSGKTEAARDAAASHTAALAGGGAASSAFLRQIGVAEVNTPAELVETLKIFHVHGPQIGTRLCSLSCSGGEAGLVADLATPLGLSFPPPSQTQRQRLGDILGPIVTLANPLDYHTFIWGDGPRTTDVFTTMLSGYDAGIFIIDPPRADRCDPSSYGPALNAVASAAKSTGKPAFAVASLPENFDEARAVELMEQGVAPLMGLEAALAAIKAVQTQAGEPGWRPVPCIGARETVLVSEAEAKAMLGKDGIPVPKGVEAKTLEELKVKATALHAPLALKGLGFSHKSEAGAVRLDLASLDGQAEMPDATGYLAEEMVTGGIAEMLIGLRRDPVYGVTLTVGMGGVTAELLADTVTLILPVGEAEVLSAMTTLRLWPLLDGYRGRERADSAFAARIAAKLGALMLADASIVEIEINPLIVRAKDAVAVDALVQVAK